MNIKKTAVLFAAVLCCGALVAACGSDDSDSNESVSISDPWSRTTTPTATTGAVYMNLESADGDKLVKAVVPTDIAGVTEIHETTGGEGHSMDSMEGMEAEGSMDGESMEGMEGMDGEGMSGDLMGMKRIDSIDLPAGEEVSLEPGGFHVMMLELTKQIEDGETIPVTLTFENAGEVEVEAIARES